MDKTYQDLTAEQVREYLHNNSEDIYQLIDVRFAEEYTEEHLPGAILIPVDELEYRVDELAKDKNILIYCLSGRRSVAASEFICNNIDIKGNVYNMLGGILAWRGQILPDMPNLQAFDISGSMKDILYQAMNLEKGAHKFYQLVLELFPDAPFTPIMEQLVNAEEAHAKMVYSFWAKTQHDPPAFERVYENLPGNILEGGLEFTTLAERLKEGEMQCQAVIDMAIAIEFSAYDLYRNMAHIHQNTELAKTFITLSQAEKKHMRIAADAIGLCS